MAQPIDNIQVYNDWGDYVPDEDDVHDVCETSDGYIVRGGYPGPPCYPVTVGELIQGGGKSYRIEHKLGHGGFSTVWLAFEVETSTLVALKIHRALTKAGQAESRIHLNDKNIMLGLIPTALDQGPTPSERYKQVGRPQKFWYDFGWRSGDLVAPIEWPKSMINQSAFLGDFGLAKRAGSPLTDDYLPPRACCAPELFHKGFEPNYASDMWGFMCIFYTLMTGWSPFTGWSDSGTLGCMTRELGPLPREWEGRYKWPDHYPDEERTWYDQSRSPRAFFFEDSLDHCREDLVGTRERELIVEVMRKGFRYQPLQRITAQQLLEDTSFLELMSIHGID
ncbi:hypothetical protein VMCG_00957 [Cytospora schulzeri]|uniref:Protein kinase domain-containing protein n=1 Tax=Cytospora schulzeri TaxID=448051 RepID=A0A423X624_9PEZI|nr:hypothetical protein VMCG_00957 [Valsa malicola]